MHSFILLIGRIVVRLKLLWSRLEEEEEEEEEYEEEAKAKMKNENRKKNFEKER